MKAPSARSSSRRYSGAPTDRLKLRVLDAHHQIVHDATSLKPTYTSLDSSLGRCRLTLALMVWITTFSRYIQSDDTDAAVLRLAFFFFFFVVVLISSFASHRSLGIRAIPQATLLSPSPSSSSSTSSPDLFLTRCPFRHRRQQTLCVLLVATTTGALGVAQREEFLLSTASTDLRDWSAKTMVSSTMARRRSIPQPVPGRGANAAREA